MQLITYTKKQFFFQMVQQQWWRFSSEGITSANTAWFYSLYSTARIFHLRWERKLQYYSCRFLPQATYVCEKNKQSIWHRSKLYVEFSVIYCDCENHSTLSRLCIALLVTLIMMRTAWAREFVLQDRNQWFTYFCFIPELYYDKKCSYNQKYKYY